MTYLQALGQIVREIRVDVGLTREACSAVLNRDHLARVEKGQQALSLRKLVELSELLGLQPSQILFAAEARLSGLDMDEFRTQNDAQLKELIEKGKFTGSVQTVAVRGVRGKRAEVTRTAVQAMQAEGRAKIEVIRELGIGRTTVDRYWLK